MFNKDEAKLLTEEISILLKSASTEQKLQIKGILIGANIAEKEKEKPQQETKRAG
ncbi:MAG: hypothetical protein QM793_15045 [Muricomes sp.]